MNKNMKAIYIIAGFLNIVLAASGATLWFLVWRIHHVDAGGPDHSCAAGFRWIQDLPAYPYHGICQPEMEGEFAAANAIRDSYIEGYDDCKSSEIN